MPRRGRESDLLDEGHGHSLAPTKKGGAARDRIMKEPNLLNIVLTGVTRGLGRALALGFAERGHRVLGCGRSAERITELNVTFGEAHDFTCLDVADEGEVREWAARSISRFGAPDLLINNAALMNDPAPLWEVGAEEFDALLAVNVAGTANVVRHFVPAMIEAGRGVIVNFSSGWGRSTAPEVGPYCTTKYAIEGLTGSLAQELPPGLAAVSLNPGVIDTDMLRQCWGEAAGAYPGPEVWSKRAVSYLLGLSEADNGRVATID